MNVMAPAKLNLRLRVLGRRADGFHAIETVLVRLALADAVEQRGYASVSHVPAPRSRAVR